MGVEHDLRRRRVITTRRFHHDTTRLSELGATLHSAANKPRGPLPCAPLSLPQYLLFALNDPLRCLLRANPAAAENFKAHTLELFEEVSFFCPPSDFATETDDGGRLWCTDYHTRDYTGQHAQRFDCWEHSRCISRVEFVAQVTSKVSTKADSLGHSGSEGSLCAPAAGIIGLEFASFSRRTLSRRCASTSRTTSACTSSGLIAQLTFAMR